MERITKIEYELIHEALRYYSDYLLYKETEDSDEQKQTDDKMNKVDKLALKIAKKYRR